MTSIRPLPAAALACALGSFFSPVQAQATQTGSSVNIYGIIDACVARSDLGDSARNLVGGGCINGSRLGFRGNEDLGAGMRAYFNIEMGFGTDEGTILQGGRGFGRKSLLGLAGPAGAVELGRDYAPTFFIVSPTDPMGLGIGTASSTIWTGSPTTSSGRVNNSIVYLSPNMAGFSVRAQFGPGEQVAPAASRGGDAKGFNVLYRNDKTIVGLSHTRVSNTANSADDSATTLVASQGWGRFSVSVMAQDGAWKGSRTAAAPASATSFFSRDYRSYLVGGSAKVGVGSINASLKKYDDRTAANFDATQWSVNYVHPLSRRTSVYGGYSRLNNKRGSSYAVSDAVVAYTGVTAGAATSFMAVGLRHTF